MESRKRGKAVKSFFSSFVWGWLWHFSSLIGNYSRPRSDDMFMHPKTFEMIFFSMLMGNLEVVV